MPSPLLPVTHVSGVGLLILVFMLAIPGLSGCTQRADTSEETTLNSLTTAAAPGDDAPILAQLGPHPVGVRTLSFSYPDHPQISLTNYLVGDPPLETRHLSVDILYPAEVSAEDASRASYAGFFATGLTEVQGLPESFEISGIAVRDAPAVQQQEFPLVILSHGFMNTPGVLSGISENLASKGYVVAAIDHGDAPREGDTLVHPFARAMLNRPVDQRRVLADILSLTKDPNWELGALIDTDHIGLIGFSMGGYGALNHLGAGLNPEGESYGMVPGDLLADLSEHNANYERQMHDSFDAAVLFAPWGAQPAAGMWTDNALAAIETPLLIFGGSQDDVSDFEGGITRIFEKTVGTDRYLMVFQNALHNLVQVPAPASAHLDVVPWQTFEDPVWRRERLIAVGNHFTTAFLDLYLKRDLSRAAYLDLPTTHSNDGEWEQPLTQDYSDYFADGSRDSERYWRGFKRRQAIGMELHHLGKGQGN